MTRALVLTAALAVSTACTPAQLATWSSLLDLPADPHDPAHLDLAADAWCLHGAALVDLVGTEAVEAMPREGLPACLPDGWVDLGNGVAGPAHLLEIRACESGDDYGAVSPSGRYRGAYQFSRATWDTVGPPGMDPAVAEPWIQDAAAVALYQSRGAQPWPVCGRR